MYSFFFRIVEENTENCRRRDQGLGQVGASNNNTSREREREGSIKLNLLQSTPYIRIVNMIPYINEDEQQIEEQQQCMTNFTQRVLFTTTTIILLLYPNKSIN